MQLVEEFTFNVQVADRLSIGDGPIGERAIFEVLGGEVTGERIRGRMLGGADWALIGADGFLRIDSRSQIETHDGANLYLQYRGLLGLNDTLAAALRNGVGTEFGEQYCYINVRIETGDERYRWVNTTFFVGEGRANPDGGVQYRVWRPA